MMWKLLNSSKLIKRVMAEQPVIAYRWVMLGDVDLSAFIDKTTDPSQASADRKLQMLLFDTCPATVVVLDSAKSEPVGAYVWSNRKPIRSSRDPRMVQLANRLADWFMPDGVNVTR